jgi:hypothetical protein
MLIYINSVMLYLFVGFLLIWPWWGERRGGGDMFSNSAKQNKASNILIFGVWSE